MGKTRLALQVLARARDAGLVTAWAVPTASAAAIPFGAMAHLLPNPLRRRSGWPTSCGPWARPSSLTIAASAWCSGADDAHLLDVSSAALVHHLASTGAAFVLATVGTGEEAPDAVRALGKDLGERLELQNLSQDEVEVLVAAVLGGEVDPVRSASCGRAAGATFCSCASSSSVGHFERCRAIAARVEEAAATGSRAVMYSLDEYTGFEFRVTRRYRWGCRSRTATRHRTPMKSIGACPRGGESRPVGSLGFEAPRPLSMPSAQRRSSSTKAAMSSLNRCGSSHRGVCPTPE